MQTNENRSPDIQVLPIGLCNQIAAGEVVERPASVVKELVENSLDAGASRIEIDLENAGQALISIRDNGSGIKQEQLGLALSRHATSKISEFQDLYTVNSFGFRGEALPSIASVAELRLESIVLGQHTASFVEVQPSGEFNSGISGLHQGTLVEVRNLFSQVPARLKFLKSPATELKRITELITRLALTRPDVAFKLCSHGREILDFPAKQSLRARLSLVWPSSIIEQLLDVQGDSAGVKIRGVASAPSSSQARADRMYFYINGRAVSDKILSAASREAYRGKLLGREYPQLVLFLDLEPGLVDVNVHPAKSEVRFQDESLIFKIVYGTLLKTLQAQLGAGEGAIAEPNIADNIANPNRTTAAGITGKPTFVQQLPDANYQRTQPLGFWGELDRERIIRPQEQALGDSGGIDLDDLGEQPISGVSRVSGVSGLAGGSGLAGLARASLSETQEYSSLTPGMPTQYSFNQAETANPDTAVQQAQLPQLGPYTYLGQVGKTYLVLRYQANYARQPGMPAGMGAGGDAVDGDLEQLLILDQHAVHEKILYTKLVQGSFKAASQALIFPSELKLTAVQMEGFFEIKAQLEALGFAFQIDSLVLKITVLPSLLSVKAGVQFVTECLEQEFPKPVLTGLDPLLCRMACRSAIKAGQELSQAEAMHLLEQWLQLPEPEFCPHGRPCMVSLKLPDLEKMFKRKP